MNNFNNFSKKYKIVSKYRLFYEFLDIQKFISKIHKNSCYATQGCCQTYNTTLITSYNTEYNINRDNFNNSILDIVYVNGTKKTLYFDNRSHVGGVAYYDKYNKIYVSASNCDKFNRSSINCYDIDDINKLHNESILSGHNIILKNNKKCSYLTVYDDSLFVGEFNSRKASNLVKYKIVSQGMNLKYNTIYNVPYKKVQGMCILLYDNCEYFVFSCSYGRYSSSKLIISILCDGKFKTIMKLKMPSMSEQVSITEDGNLMIVFESDSIKYSENIIFPFKKKFVPIDDVCYLNVDRIFSYIKKIKSSSFNF